MADSKFTQVSKDDFWLFVKSYPNKLETDVAGMYEPPIQSWNDFTLGKWPESIVAYVNLYDGSEYHRFKHPEYFIDQSTPFFPTP